MTRARRSSQADRCDQASGGVLGDETAVRFRTYDATAAYVRERAAGAPLMLVLDDLHWADISSLRMLTFLARQLHDTPRWWSGPTGTWR